MSNWISNSYGTAQNPQPLWTFTAGSGVTRSNQLATTTASVWYTSSPKMYYSTKTYIIKTQVKAFTEANGYLGISAPWEFDKTSFEYSNFKTPNLSSSDKEILTGTGPSSPIEVSWGTMSFATVPETTETDNTLIYIGRPSADYTSGKGPRYSSYYNGFKNGYIRDFSIIELDWNIVGYSFATSSDVNRDDYYEGWRYSEVNDSFVYNYYGMGISSAAQNKKLPAGTEFYTTKSYTFQNGLPVLVNKTSVNTKTKLNYISKFIEYTKFNFSFSFNIDDATLLSIGYVTAYLIEDDYEEWKKKSNALSRLVVVSQTKDYEYNSTFRTWLKTGQVLGKIDNPGTYSFYNLDGNNYIVFVANYEYNSKQIAKYKITLDNFYFEGGYSKLDNNNKFNFTNTLDFFNPTPLSIIGQQTTSTFSVTTVTDKTAHFANNNYFGPVNGTASYSGFFSNLYGSVLNLSNLSSKVGNGTFKKGIWENGVWNNGWRLDEFDYEFNDILYVVNLNTKNQDWRIQITGSTASTSQFNIGDKVSVGNIIAIDINENRKFLKNYFTIIDKTDSDLILETFINFPIYTIQKDSQYHQIKISKNVWLNGAFLNGYFGGVWNDGLFKGGPYITYMENSSWIDGKFDGGHLKTSNYNTTFVDTRWVDSALSLTFSTPHKFQKDDKIVIDKTNKGINPNYDGVAKVVSVPDPYSIITDKLFESSSTNEGGLVKKYTNTGLVQNFNFNDNNIAKKTVSNSNYLKQIWNFNSWIDVNWSTQSSTNIGRYKTSYNPLGTTNEGVFNNKQYGIGEYTVLNLYGYITEDVLSSVSTFRDSNSLSRTRYSLGTKYKIYEDFLGNISEFLTPFGNSDSVGGPTNFINDGWSLSYTEPIFGDRYARFQDNNYWPDGLGNEYVAFLFGSTYPPFNEGETVFIEQDAGYTHPEYEGYTQVRGISASGDNWFVVTEIAWPGSSPVNPGTMSVVYTLSGDGYTYSRTVDGTFKLENPEHSNQVVTLNNDNIIIERNRYSVVEFDLIDYKQGLDYNPVNLYNFKNFQNPDFSFSDKTMFPVSDDIDYRNSKETKKVEYFFNRLKLNLGMFSLAWEIQNLSGADQWSYVTPSTIELDNVKFYEVDMIPFFQYTTEDYVNQTAIVPYQGIAPYIDYNDSDFVFIENINISQDSIAVSVGPITISPKPPIYTAPSTVNNTNNLPASFVTTPNLG